MLSLSDVAKVEKNKVSSTGVWLILLDIELGEQHLRIVRNNDYDNPTVWNGNTYQSFPFNIGDTGQDSKGELPKLTIKVSNANGLVEQQINDLQGGVGAKVALYVVHSEHLDLTTPEIEEHYVVKAVTAEEDWVTFTLAGDMVLSQAVPCTRYLKDSCPYQYKDVRCGYNGALPSCNHTLSDCVAHGNTLRFGGYPAIPGAGTYKSNA